ncbi:hypothetical protein GCM10008025_21360 [Ornithinibacillus halotolerans]|uniref:Uncharacterized protein n=1 Tax=Ornithinibacillus halotolerans TaxID=1274357 RepID=A0A916W982_9BACI|nr:hypothetical protein GCM10008025_21360 [Ornithinibacillus halotolerans]
MDNWREGLIRTKEHEFKVTKGRQKGTKLGSKVTIVREKGT